jgi:hypothetical protein
VKAGEVYGTNCCDGISLLWLDGRFTAVINDVKVNVPADAAKFGKP